MLHSLPSVILKISIAFFHNDFIIHVSCNSLGKPTFGLCKRKFGLCKRKSGLCKRKFDLVKAPTTTISTMYMDILGKVLCRVRPVPIHWLIFNAPMGLGNADLHTKYHHKWFYMQPPKQKTLCECTYGAALADLCVYDRARKVY